MLVLYNINNTLSTQYINISVLPLPAPADLDVLPDDDVVQLLAEVRGWPDCGQQEGPDIRLSPELSPDEARVGLGDVLGERRPGRGQ